MLKTKMQKHVMWAVVDGEGRIVTQFMSFAIFATRREAREVANSYCLKVIKINIVPHDPNQLLYGDK